MAVTINQINTAADSFQDWVDRTNDLANTVSVQVVTCNTHANGGLTTGNGFVEGVFGSRTAVANTIRGGTIQTPGVLTLSSNLNVTGNTVTVGDVVINSTSIAVDGIPLETGGATFETNTSGTSAYLIDYFDKITYRSCEYLLSIKDNQANAYQASKVLVIHPGGVGNAYLIEYGVVYSNASLGEMSANANSTHVKLYFTPTSTNTHVNGTKLLVVL